MLLRSPPSTRADRASEISVYLSLRLSVHPSSCLMFSKSVCLSVCLGVRPFVRPSVRPCLSPSLPRRVGHRVTTFQTDGSCPFNSPYIQSRVRPTTTLPGERTEPMSDCATVAPIHIMLARWGSCDCTQIRIDSLASWLEVYNDNQLCPRAAADQDKELRKHETKGMTTLQSMPSTYYLTEKKM